MKTHSEDKIREKMLAFQIKATTYLSGTKKNAFMLDCIKRGTYECALLREIVSLHYSLMEAKPELKGKEFSDIREIILSKL